MRAPSFNAWVTVGLLWVVAVLNYLDRLMISSMREPLRDSIPMSDQQFGLLSAVFLWVYAAMSPMAGYLADRLGRRRLILISLAVWSAVTWWTGHAGSFTELLVSRAAMGVSEACYIPAALALICDYHRGTTRSLATGIHMSGIYTGAALGGVGGWVAEHWGWRSGFIGFGVIGVAYSCVLLRWLKDAPPSSDLEQESRPDSASTPSIRDIFTMLLGERGFCMLLVINIFWGSSNAVVGTWLPTYLREHFHLGIGHAGILASAYPGAAAFAGVLVGGLLSDRWSPAQPRARMLLPSAAFLLAAPCLAFAVSTDTLPLALAGLVVFGLARGCFDANHMPIVRKLTDQRLSAAAFGLLNFISCAAGGLMTYAGGLLMDVHMDLGVVFLAVAIGLLALGLLLLLIRPRRSVLVFSEPTSLESKPSCATQN